MEQMTGIDALMHDIETYGLAYVINLCLMTYGAPEWPAEPAAT